MKSELPFAKTRSHVSEEQVHTWKNHFVAASGEFVGTVLFLYFAFATQTMALLQAGLDATSNGGNSSQTIVVISLGYGFSLLVTAWTLYRVSGGLFNPAVSPPASHLFHPKLSLTAPFRNRSHSVSASQAPSPGHGG
jgi:hypothetical protein